MLSAFPPSPQLKLVLDLATPEKFKAELTWWWLYPKIVYPPKTATYLRNNQAVSWLRMEPATASREFDVLTTRPPSQLRVNLRTASTHRLEIHLTH